MNELQGMRVAFLVANEDVEQVELTSPWAAVTQAGGHPELVAPQTGSVQAFNHLDGGDTFTATVDRHPQRRWHLAGRRGRAPS